MPWSRPQQYRCPAVDIEPCSVCGGYASVRIFTVNHYLRKVRNKAFCETHAAELFAQLDHHRDLVDAPIAGEPELSAAAAKLEDIINQVPPIDHRRLA